MLKDIVESGEDCVVTESMYKLSEKELAYMKRKTKDGRTHWDYAHHNDIKDNKSSCITANMYKGVPYNVLKDYNIIRKLMPIECERLQGVRDGYTAKGMMDGKEIDISNTQRYKMLGNGWTVDVIAHIFKNMEGTH